MSWEARTVLMCRGLNRRDNASEDLFEDVAFLLDPALKHWLGSSKRAHVMQSFCANLHPLHQRHGPSKDDGQRLNRVGTWRAETRETRHWLGQLFETASEFGSPHAGRELPQQERRATTQRPIFDKGDDTDPGAGNPKRLLPNCQCRAVC